MQNEISITVLEPTFPEAKDITQEDVWGKWVGHNKVHLGMIVADCRTGGYDDDKYQSKERCPVFEDFIDYKSVTVIAPKELSEQVAYWLEYVQGSDCISQFKELPDGKVAFRADYQAW